MLDDLRVALGVGVIVALGISLVADGPFGDVASALWTGWSLLAWTVIGALLDLPAALLS
jgi:hypothetical protein